MGTARCTGSRAGCGIPAATARWALGTAGRGSARGERLTLAAPRPAVAARGDGQRSLCAGHKDKFRFPLIADGSHDEK